MRTWQMKSTVALIAVAVLAGCGKNPASAPETEKRVGQFQTIKKTGAAATAKAPAAGTSQAKASTTTKKPGAVTTTAGTKPAATAPKPGTTSPATTGGTTQQAAGDEEGALRLTVRLWGTSPIGSLKVQVFAPGATEGVDVPLQLTGPEAVWEQEDLPAGDYTLHVFAYGPDGKAIGKGETHALVKGGELRDLSLDVTTNKNDTVGIASTPEPTATPSAAPSAEPTATPTPAATATPTPAPSGPGFGGTLGLRVEIF